MKSQSDTPFSFDTINDFDQHIELSIPNYRHITDLVCSISDYFITDRSFVYDLGCSTGLLLKRLAARHKNTHFVGLDKADNLLGKNQDTENLSLVKHDFRVKIPRLQNACLVTSIFTLQFLPIDTRVEIVKAVYHYLKPGGAFIVCEKTYSQTGPVQDIYTFAYYDFKRASFDEKAILDKQKVLRKIMKPLTSQENETILRQAGFTNIETFFQSLSFKGWLCIK